MPFRYAHASHPDGNTAVELCLAQLAAQATADSTQRGPNLGFVYLTENLQTQADSILAQLKVRTGVSNWVGASASAICATGIEYVDEPALAIMLGRFAPGSFNVFSGAQRPPARGTRTDRASSAAYTALVHADPYAPGLPGLIEDMARKVDSGHLFGGLASGREPPLTIADRVLRGGLSGVVFAADVPLVSRVTQGCHPLPGSRRRRITAAEDNLIATLDDEPAFDALLQDAGIVESVAALDSSERTREALAQLKALGRRGMLFVGIDPEHAEARGSRWRDDYLVRPVVAIDPSRGAVAVGMPIERGQTVRFCVRDESAARKDLTRICAEIRDHLHEESERQRRPVGAKGAIYVSCVGRGTHLFGEQSEELRVVAQQLGAMPLVGFYANGEISGRSLYGYTGVLTVFY
jgi:small ligand-binding sensory domain FIST